MNERDRLIKNSDTNQKASGAAWANINMTVLYAILPVPVSPEAPSKARKIQFSGWRRGDLFLFNARFDGSPRNPPFSQLTDRNVSVNIRQSM